MSEKVYILREYNVYVDDMPNPISVWVGRGDGRDYEHHGTKLVGPLPGDGAEEVIDHLKGFLEQLGHEVVVETSADD